MGTLGTAKRRAQPDGSYGTEQVQRREENQQVFATAQRDQPLRHQTAGNAAHCPKSGDLPKPPFCLAKVENFAQQQPKARKKNSA